MRRALAASFVACAVVMGAAGTANAVIVVAVPGSFEAGFATPVTIARPGVPLTFASTDLEPHNVVALEARRPNGTAAWCSMPRYAAGKCPLFWSETIGQGVTAVLGLDDGRVTPGASYTFYCEIHPDMVGTLVIAPA